MPQLITYMDKRPVALWDNYEFYQRLLSIIDGLPSGGGAVDSVNGQTGVVVLDSDDISEGSTNLYFTTARARASFSAGTGISITTGVIDNTAPDQTVVLNNGTGISVTGTYPNFTITNTSPSSGGTVTSVSGTANRITSTGGTTPVIDISASYVGQSSITTLGTIGTGVWQGTAVADSYIASAATWNAKQAQLNGTGFVKASGTTISYDNSTYLTGNQTITLTGAVTGSGATSISTTLANNVVGIANHSATGTPSSSTYLRGDNTWATPTASVTRAIVFNADGQSATLSTGSKAYLTIPYACTLTNYYITGDVSGSIVIDVKRSGTTIIGSGNKPTLSSAQRNNAALSGWTSVAISANDELEFNIDSCTTITRINLVLVAT